MACWALISGTRRAEPVDSASLLPRSTRPPASPLEREKAVHHALDCLYAIARRESVFRLYDGHLLLALALAASTSRSRGLRRKATAMGRERARRWMTRWPLIRSRLDADSVMQQVIASDGARGHLPYSYQYPSSISTPREDVPMDVPAECACGTFTPRGRRACATCGRRLKLLDTTR